MSRSPRRAELGAVAAGGALGAAARYLLGLAFPDPAGTGFPWTTFAINVIGCLAIGVLAGIVLGHVRRLFLGAGFLGGFTTFSTYANQTIELVHHGQMLTAALYLAGTLAAALLATGVSLSLVEGRWR